MTVVIHKISNSLFSNAISENLKWVLIWYATKKLYEYSSTLELNKKKENYEQRFPLYVG